MQNTSELIRQFIVDNFMFGNDEGLTDDTSFLDEGIIDSTGVLELVAFIEENFSIRVADEELVPENLDSINNVTNYIQKKTNTTAVA
ncbi:MAG: acyl carrier protein [Desulfobacteraceae bacterium]|jgi:acyl carrier protein